MASENTGRKNSFWKLLADYVEHKIACYWCAGHISDWVDEDMEKCVGELKLLHVETTAVCSISEHLLYTHQRNTRNNSRIRCNSKAVSVSVRSKIRSASETNHWSCVTQSTVNVSLFYEDCIHAFQCRTCRNRLSKRIFEQAAGRLQPALFIRGHSGCLPLTS